MYAIVEVSMRVSSQLNKENRAETEDDPQLGKSSQRALLRDIEGSP